MTGFPWTTLATLLVLLHYVILGMLVSRARGRHGVMAPTVTGHPAFERIYRVHLNTLEQLPVILPLMWLGAANIGDAWGALGGLAWVAGRVIYVRAYLADPARRTMGFVIAGVPVVALFLAILIAIGMRWL